MTSDDHGGKHLVIMLASVRTGVVLWDVIEVVDAKDIQSDADNDDEDEMDLRMTRVGEQPRTTEDGVPGRSDERQCRERRCGLFVCWQKLEVEFQTSIGESLGSRCDDIAFAGAGV